MSLANAYICESELAEHICDPCPGDADNREYARVRGTAIIYKDYLATLLGADPTLPASWQAGIFAGKIIIIPETAGSFDPGEPKELRGFGERRANYGPRTQTLNFVDPSYKSNYNFWNNIESQTNLVLAFKTSSQIHIADSVSDMFAKDVVPDDLEAEVVWEVTAKWISRNLPQLHDGTGLSTIFTCAA